MGIKCAFHSEAWLPEAMTQNSDFLWVDWYPAVEQNPDLAPCLEESHIFWDFKWRETEPEIPGFSGWTWDWAGQARAALPAFELSIAALCCAISLFLTGWSWDVKGLKHPRVFWNDVPFEWDACALRGASVSDFYLRYSWRDVHEKLAAPSQFQVDGPYI